MNQIQLLDEEKKSNISIEEEKLHNDSDCSHVPYYVHVEMTSQNDELPYTDIKQPIPSILPKQFVHVIVQNCQKQKEEQKNYVENSIPEEEFEYNDEKAKTGTLINLKRFFSASSPSKIKNIANDYDFNLDPEEKPLEVIPAEFLASLGQDSEKKEDSKPINDKSKRPNNAFQIFFKRKIKLRYIMYSFVSVGVILLMLILHFASTQTKSNDSFVSHLNFNTIFNINLSYCKLIIREASNEKVSYNFQNRCWSCSENQFVYQGDLDLVTISAIGTANTLQFCKLELFIPTNLYFSLMNITCLNECYFVQDSANLMPLNTKFNGNAVYVNIRKIQTDSFSYNSTFGHLLINEIDLKENATISLDYGDVIFQTSKSDVQVSWYNTRDTSCFAGPYTQSLSNSNNCVTNNDSSISNFFSLIS